MADGSTAGAFVGNFTHSLDSKRRLTIPASWREKAGGTELFVLPGVKIKCLYVFPADEMMRKLEKFRNLSVANEKAQRYARALFSRANQLPWDAQGRIRISDDLLDYAQLINQVQLVGVGTRFELWSPEKWQEAQMSVDQPSDAEVAESIGF